MPLEDIIKSLKTGLNPRGNFQLNTLDSKGFYVTVREIQNGKVSFLDKTDRVDNRALELINNRSNLDKRRYFIFWYWNYWTYSGNRRNSYKLEY